MADNLSSASDGQSLLKMTVATNENYSIQIGDPVLPCHRKVQRRSEIGALVSEAPNSVEAKYRIVYCEVIDYAVNAIQWRFDQDGYNVLL